ncbi:putative thiol peroxidase [Paratrimastix pyriformis]|uniref:Thiol peroxidase n=1 Tax=Paratrimastix pyriformis TaxID=342808 RepID=A0ABQ8UGR7_9EUKA|nr:putative thiol peroxidase [Paratrimastix pyriformis]
MEKIKESMGMGGHHTVKDKGQDVNLTGSMLSRGSRLKDFTVTDMNSNNIRFSETFLNNNKNTIIYSFPSVDTPICSQQCCSLASCEHIKGHPDVQVFGISMDLPFALARYHREHAHDLEGMTLLSDSIDGDFGSKYGLLIREKRLLARAVLLFDHDGKLVYDKINDDVGTPIDCNELYQHLHQLRHPVMGEHGVAPTGVTRHEAGFPQEHPVQPVQQVGGVQVQPMAATTTTTTEKVEPLPMRPVQEAGLGH